MSTVAVMPTDTAAAHAAEEPLRAARHAATLGGALAVTTAIAMVVKLLVPRVLGPEAFGDLRLAESMAELLFVVLTLGVDMQMRREAALDPTTTRRYLSGLAVWRLGLGVIGVIGLGAILTATGAAPRVLVLFGLLSLGQMLLVLNNSFAAYEQAAGDVRWLARTNLGVKLVWAGVMLAALVGSGTGIALAIAGTLVEAARCAWFLHRGFTRHQFHLSPDVKLAGAAIVASLPFFVHLVAHTVYARLGVAWLGAVATPAEVGLFGAASTFAGVALLGMPLLSWVLVPSAARAAAASDDHLRALVAGALRVALLGAVPVAFVSFVWAGDLLALAFGEPYRDAAPALQWIAPTFALAYVATVSAITALQRGQVRVVATISVLGLALTVALDAVLIPWGLAHLGVAGGAQGAAAATLLTEIAITLALTRVSRPDWRLSRLGITALALSAAALAGAFIAAWASPLAGATTFLATLIATGGLTRADLTFVRHLLQETR